MSIQFRYFFCKSIPIYQKMPYPSLWNPPKFRLPSKFFQINLSMGDYTKDCKRASPPFCAVPIYRIRFEETSDPISQSARLSAVELFRPTAAARVPTDSIWDPFGTLPNTFCSNAYMIPVLYANASRSHHPGQTAVIRRTSRPMKRRIPHCL